MPVWATLPADKQPNLTLSQWSVVELPDGSLHLVGYCIETRQRRVSSRIALFDVERLMAVTTAGRSYGLIGHPGGNREADYAWNNWASQHGVTSFTDVSRDIWERSAKGRDTEARRSDRASTGAA